MYYFYAIRSLKNQSIYKGISDDFAHRLIQHNAGKCASTRPYIPYSLVYVEECEDREEARDREKYYKTGYGRSALKEIIDECRE